MDTSSSRSTNTSISDGDVVEEDDEGEAEEVEKAVDNHRVSCFHSLASS